MKIIRRAIRLSAIAAIVIGANVFSQTTVKLEHDSSWEVAGRRCTIRVLQLANLSSEETGPLYLSLYARAGAGYDGHNSRGRFVSRARIASIPGNTTTSIVVTARAHRLSPHERYSTLFVEAKNDRRYVVADYVVYTSTYTFPRRQSGGVGSDDSGITGGEIGFTGTNALSVHRRRATFAIEGIQNHRELTGSGLLRLAVYATREPYDGGTNRTIIARRTLGRLSQGDFYNHLRGTLDLHRPGRGDFYLTLALEEFEGNRFVRVTHVSYPELRHF
jgi:hypothetical protein